MDPIGAATFYGRFAGNRRDRASPSESSKQSLYASVAVRKGVAQKVIDLLWIEGSSHHSARPALLWVLLEWAYDSRHQLDFVTHFYDGRIVGHSVYDRDPGIIAIMEDLK